MRQDRISDIIGSIDDTYVDEATRYAPGGDEKRVAITRRIKWLVPAACLVLSVASVLSVGAVVGKYVNRQTRPNKNEGQDQWVTVEPVFLANLFSWEDYTAFMASDPDLPENFVHYEDGLYEIGAFKELIIQDRAHCFYQFTDANNAVISLYISDISDNSELIEVYEEPTSSVPMEKLTEISKETAKSLPPYSKLSPYAKDGQTYYHNGSALYVYNETGKCFGIHWYEDGLEFVLTCLYSDNPDGPNSLYDYPTDREDTFVARLFDPATAEETVRALKQTIGDGMNEYLTVR